MFFQRNRYLFLLFIICCGNISSVSVADEKFIQFDSKHLHLGRSIWLDNCKGCHAYGTAGAPIPMIAEDWQARVTKSTDILYDHAINGFFGPDDTMMPERGGNPELTDQQVKSAVDYMLALARHYIALKK